MSAASDFRGDYSPGGLSGRSLRRARARRAGLASGVARRRLSRGRQRRHRSRSRALALAYSHRQLPRRRFAELYEQAFPRPEHGPAAAAWEKGQETLWRHYEACWRLYRACGQHTRTTNAQRRAALEARRRTRCRRTVQRLNGKLDVLGLAVLSHLKNQGATPGHRDCLVLEIRTYSQRVTPPAGAGTLPSGQGVPALPARGIAPAARAVPPDGGGQRQAASPPVTEKEQLEAQIHFQQLKLDSGFGDAASVTAKLADLHHRLAATEGPASPPARRPDSGDRHISP